MPEEKKKGCAIYYAFMDKDKAREVRNGTLKLPPPENIIDDEMGIAHLYDDDCDTVKKIF